MVTKWRPNPSLYPNPEEGNSRETKKTHQEDDTLATLDRRTQEFKLQLRTLLSDQMWSVSHHTALQTQEGKHKKAQQEDDTLQHSIDVGDRFEDEPREFNLQIRTYNFERHSPIKCDQSPPPTLHSHRKKANPRKTQQDHDTLVRTIDYDEWSETNPGTLQLGPLSQPNAVSLRSIWAPRRESGRTQENPPTRTTPCGARSTDAGEWSETTHPGIGTCELWSLLPIK